MKNLLLIGSSLCFLLVISVTSPYRIINGKKASYGQFPGSVSIQGYNGGHYCGGTLLTATVVITAAHCFDSLELTQTCWSQVRILGNDLIASKRTNSPLSRQIRFARWVLIHPEYDAKLVSNDLSILKLFTPFERSRYFYPIPWSKERFPVGVHCNVSGWGDTRGNAKNKRMSDKLLYINIEILQNSYCFKPDYHPFHDSTQYCAGELGGGKDACFGDSGGGLTCDRILAGVVSYGIGCGLETYPGVYTDISAYTDWIESLIHWNGLTPIQKVLIEYKNGMDIPHVFGYCQMCVWSAIVLFQRFCFTA